MLFGPDRPLTLANNSNGESGKCSDGVNVWLAWVNAGTGAVTVVKSNNYGYDGFGVVAPVVVDTNAANSAVMLNEPFVIDPVNGDLYLFWDRNEGNGSLAPTMMMSRSTNGGASWSAAVTVDNGAGHAANRFYRAGVVAYSGVVHVVYSCIDSSVFTTDGLWHTESINNGVTWAAPSILYTVATAGEPNVYLGEDASLHVSWYDSGVNANAGGDLYYTRGTWSAAGWTFPGAKTRVTTGQVCGRSRISASAGMVNICTNTNWGGSIGDVGNVHSADNGATWGSMVTVAVHTPGASLTHPAFYVEGLLGLMIWLDVQTTLYGSAFTTDGGATWALGPRPFAATASSDAPAVIAAGDVVLSFGAGLVYTAYPLFAEAVTTAPLVDQFNRADENPLSNGGKWTQDIGAGDMPKLVSNQVVRQLTPSNFDRAGAYRNDISLTTGEAYITCAAASSSGEVEVRMMDEAGNNGYTAQAQVNFGAPTAVDLLKITGGSQATLTPRLTSVSLTTGDKYLIRVTTNDVVFFRFISASSDWQEIMRGRDNTFRTGLRPAFHVASQTGGPTVDDFGAGTLVAPSNTALPVASGTIGIGNVLTVTKGTWDTANGATPTRYFFKWQSSPAGAGTWSDIPQAALPSYTVADATKDYRCVVTGKNSISSVSANSNVLSGSQTGAPAAAVSTWVAVSPGVTGAVAVLPAAAVSTWVAVSPGVTPGTATGAPAAAVSTWVAVAPSLSGGGSVAPAAAVSTWVAVSPGIVVGAVTALPAAAVSTWVAVSPGIAQGSGGLIPAAAVSTWVAVSPGTVVGAVTALPAAAVSRWTMGTAQFLAITGGVVTPLTYTWYRSALRQLLSTFTRCSTGFAVLSASGSSFTRSSGSFLQDGFYEGDEIVVAGFTTTGNNGRWYVTSVSDTVLGVTRIAAPTQLAAEGPVIASIAVQLPVGLKTEGRQFTPITGQPWLRETYKPTTSLRRSLGPRAFVRQEGLMLLDVFYPINVGIGGLDATADALLRLFYPGVVLSYSGQALTVRSSFRAGTVEEPNWVMAPVTVRFFANTLNPS